MTLISQKIFTIKKTLGVTSIGQYFAISSSSSTAPTVWQSTPLVTTSTNKYLWYYEQYIYTDGSTKNTTARVIGVYGDKGDKGDQGNTGASTGAFVKYSNDNGATFTSPSSTELAKIPSAPTCIIGQTETSWESGKYSITDGTKATDATFIRTKDYWAITAGKVYVVKTHLSAVNMTLVYYNSSKVFISASSAIANGAQITVPAGVAFMTLFANTTMASFRNALSTSFVPAVF